jgi:prepilin-type N-terminal cleavage/methylation domain-containing protein
MTRKGFTLIELLVVIVIIGILVAIALPNFIKIKDKAKEAEVKQNCHAIQLALERYATDVPGALYPLRLYGGDWTDTETVWEEWVNWQQDLDPGNITKYNFGGETWIPAELDMGDTLIMESYLPSYPGNPFMKNKSETLLPTINHYPNPSYPGHPQWYRIVGGRESNKMYETFGPMWTGPSFMCSNAGDIFVHHIFNNPEYDAEGDYQKNPPGGWRNPSGNSVLVGNFSYYARAGKGQNFSLTSGGDPVGYTVAGYGSRRTPGQDVYNRNGNYKGRFRTEACYIDCRGDGGVYQANADIPCICDGDQSFPTISQNNGGSDSVADGVVITLDSGVDKKSARVNITTTEGT